MRRLLFTILPLLLLASCSPQKQLTRLLNRHPELRQDSIITIRDTIVIEPVAAEISFTLDDLISVAQQPDTANADSDPPSGISVSAGGAVATIYQKDGLFTLRAQQKQDTIFIERIKTVPAYYTKTAIKEVEVKKPYSRFVKFLIGSGAAIWLILLILITIGIVRAVKS